MSFTNPGPLGGYVTGDFITEDQINYWCTALPDCVDGAGGGTYALSNPLIFTGDVVDVDDLVVNDDLSVLGDTTIGNAAGDALTVNATASFTPLATFNGGILTGDLTVNGSTIIGNASGDTLTVTATTTFNNDVTIGSSAADTLTVTSSALFGNDVELGASSADTIMLNGNTILQGLMSDNGSGGRQLRTFQNVTTASSSVNILQRRFVLLNSSLVGTTTTTLTGTPVSGDWFVCQNGDAASQNIDGVVTASLSANTGAMYIYDGSAWIRAVYWAA